MTKLFNSTPKILRHLLVAASALTLAACATATPYQPASEPGGYDGFSQQMIENDRARITFGGNSLTNRETVENYLLYRAAEIHILDIVFIVPVSAGHAAIAIPALLDLIAASDLVAVDLARAASVGVDFTGVTILSLMIMMSGRSRNTARQPKSNLAAPHQPMMRRHLMRAKFYRILAPRLPFRKTKAKLPLPKLD